MLSQALPVENKAFSDVGRKWNNNFDFYQRKTRSDQYKNEGLWGPLADVAETGFNAFGATVETILNPNEHFRKPKTKNGRVWKTGEVKSADIKTPSMSKNNKMTKSGLTVAEAAANNRSRQIRQARARRNNKLRRLGQVPPAPKPKRGRFGGPGKRGVGRLPMDAPVNMSQNRKSGVQLSFSSGRVPGCMRMHIKFGIGQIGAGFIGGAGPFLSFINVGTPLTGTATQMLTLNPSDGFYFPGYIYQLARLFAKFYVNKATLDICPRVSTINTAAWTIAFSKDIMWPEGHNALFATVCHPSEIQLKSLTNACTEIAYRDCSITALDVDKKREFFMGYTDSFDSAPLSYGSFNAAELRQSHPGLFMIAGQLNGSDPAGTVYSDVYMTLDIELCEFSTPLVQDIDLRVKKTKVGDDEEKTRNNDFDDHFSVVSSKSSSRKSRNG
jgi:hypothetical protein